MIPAITIVQK